MRELLNLATAGIMVGAIYGLIAVTVTLMFRTTGVLSFAHGGFALIGSYTYAGFVCPKGGGVGYCTKAPVFSPFVAALVAVGISTAVALLTERFVIRPLMHASATRQFIGTAAVLGLASGVMLQLNGPQARAIPDKQRLFPVGGFNILDVVVDRQRAAIFVISLILVTALAVILRRTWFGLGLRGAGQDGPTAELMGVRPVNVARFNWALAGAVSGLAGVLVAPLTVVNVGTFAFMMVNAVGASLFGGLVSLPLSFIGGIGIGIIEAVVPRYVSTPGVANVGIAALVVGFFTLNRHRFAAFGSGDTSDFEPVVGPVGRAVARALNYLAEILRWIPKPVRVLALVGVALFPLRNDYYGAIGLNVLYYALAALSIYLILGLAGQPSLMQAGFVGIGAYSVTTGVSKGLPVPAAMAVGVVLAGLVGVLTGLFSLRFRRLQFAIISLAFGSVIGQFLLTRHELTSNMAAPSLLGFDLLKSRNAYVLVAILALVAFVATSHLKRSTWGLQVTATKELQSRIGHFGLSPLRNELVVFCFSAMVAGLAGCVYAFIANLFNAVQFSPLASVTLLLAAVVGGTGSVWGALIAGVIFGYGPQLIGSLGKSGANAYPQIVSSAMALILIVKVPGGLASTFGWAQRVARRSEPPSGFRGGRLELAERDVRVLVGDRAPDGEPSPATGRTSVLAGQES
jgi:branched-chain amino acid transport system permease protein